MNELIIWSSYIEFYRQNRLVGDEGKGRKQLGVCFEKMFSEFFQLKMFSLWVFVLGSWLGYFISGF